MKPTIGVVRFLMLLLLASLTGCSALVASIARGDDIGVLDDGVTREIVEDEFGRPKSVRPFEDGLEATYEIRLPNGNSAENANKVLSAGGRMLMAGAYAEQPEALLIGAILAVPAMVGTDFVLTVRELKKLRNRRRHITVLYDADNRVIGFDRPEEN